MGKHYEIVLTVGKLTEDDEVEDIEEVFEEMCDNDLDESYTDGEEGTGNEYELVCFGDHTIPNIDSAKQFTERLAKKIWKTIGRFVPVTVDAYIPHPKDTFKMTEEDYKAYGKEAFKALDGGVETVKGGVTRG